MKRNILLLVGVGLVGWILTDLLLPRRIDLRQFDPDEVARLDGTMWRAYYERKPLILFWQSAELVRQQLHAPFWRSFGMAYHAAKAAFVFKDGKDRRDYNRALPDLEAFYGAINQLSNQPLNVPVTARNELEWWIIRRERERHPPAEWTALQARIAAELYHSPVASCTEYGHLRTQAMLLRDQKGDSISEADWQHIHELLAQSWRSLAKSLRALDSVAND